MLLKFARRAATEISPRLLAKAGYLWIFKAMRTMRVSRRRAKQGQLSPPFLMLALTSACTLRCRGCWIDTGGPPSSLSAEQVDAIIASGRRNKTYYYTLLGGEPLIYPGLWDLLARHGNCYFQIITNGISLDEATAARIRKLGNVTPLVSIDGMEEQNDARRGPGVFQQVDRGLRNLQQEKILYGVATTVTGANFDEVMSDEYVQHFIDRGAMYLWYYIFRPVGADPAPELCVQAEQVTEMRRRLMRLRRKHPIILIDTYWTAEGQAVCPAALGLSCHIGPRGSIEPCPPLSFARETVDDGDLYETIRGSEFLTGFQQFVTERTRGCVILEHPQALAEYIRGQSAVDYSGRDAVAEIDAGTPRNSHHLPGEEIPEDYWVYRFLKKRLFFGMGAYG